MMQPVCTSPDPGGLARGPKPNVTQGLIGRQPELPIPRDAAR